jgi:hypothetical protein
MDSLSLQFACPNTLKIWCCYTATTQVQQHQMLRWGGEHLIRAFPFLEHKGSWKHNWRYLTFTHWRAVSSCWGSLFQSPFCALPVSKPSVHAHLQQQSCCLKKKAVTFVCSQDTVVYVHRCKYEHDSDAIIDISRQFLIKIKVRFVKQNQFVRCRPQYSFHSL